MRDEACGAKPLEQQAKGIGPREQEFWRKARFVKLRGVNPGLK
jgi:hypothetical protein